MIAKTIAEKILSAHCGHDATAGEIVVCDIDLMMGHDANGPMAIRVCEELGGKVASPEKIVFVVDHASPAPYERVSNLQKLLRDFSKENDIRFFDAGEGVCHQLLIEEGLVGPGDLVVGTDSHTCTAGAVGAFATGMGATDMGVAFSSGKNWFKVPETIRVNLTGKLPSNCSSKDIILYVVGKIGADGGNYRAFEFYGNYIEECTLADRMTMANMIVEMGGKTGFMCHKDLGIEADAGATYCSTVDIDLGDMVPGAAKPHTVDNYTTIDEISEMPFQMAFLGSCTNGRIEDLREAAEVLRSKKISPDVRLLVIPASKSVLIQAVEEGVYLDLMNAGAVFFTPGCGACVGTHGGVPGDDEVVLSTANRNFKGRMGNNKAFIYLVSPKTLAYSCLKGVVTVPPMVIGGV